MRTNAAFMHNTHDARQHAAGAVYIGRRRFGPGPIQAVPSLPLQDMHHWIALATSAPEDVRALLDRVIAARGAALADRFYDTMLADGQAREMLDHEVVNSRLRASLQRWLRELMTVRDARGAEQAMAMQRHVGMVHARVNVGIHLVLRGARALRAALAEEIAKAADDQAQALHAVTLAGGLIDLAVEVMSLQYMQSHDLAARTDEAYRAFASSVNMTLERERQRNALLDWERQFLQDAMMGAPGEDLVRIGRSSFGLWIQHKAVAMFTPGAELAAIRASMQHIDQAMLPMCQQAAERGEPDELRRMVRQVLGEVGQIRYFKDAMFEHLVDMEVGRDALTQLLNRRFLPAILTREIEMSRRSGHPFAVLLIDVDHFKAINDQHGHPAGDRVLAHLASVLANTVRSGDFVFRFGGEEFLAVIVETDAAAGARVAEKIRQAVAAESFILPNGGTLRATISVGVAGHDGHPDYQHLIDAADRALYEAKRAGRNRVFAGPAA